MAVPPRAPSRDDDEPLPLREMARRAGVAESTLRNWASRPDRPLQVARHSPRDVTVTPSELRAFCAAHPRLRRTAWAAANLNHRLTEPLDPQALRSALAAVVAAVRAANAAQLEVAEATTRRAENTAAVCRAHAVALAGAIDGLTDALTRVDELN